MLRQSSDEDDDESVASLKMSSNLKKSQFVQELVLSTLMARNVVIGDDKNGAKTKADDVDEDSDQESDENLS